MANIENLRTCSSGKVEVVAGETILISPGHGLDRPNEANSGCVLTISKNGEKIILKEVNIIYDFCRLLYIELDKVGLSYINLKERIAETTMDFTIKKRNEIANQIDKKVDASIQLCVHADANTKGYSGISLFYIAGKDRSETLRLALRLEQLPYLTLFAKGQEHHVVRLVVRVRYGLNRIDMHRVSP